MIIARKGGWIEKSWLLNTWVENARGAVITTTMPHYTFTM
jgi:hypothetical protein